MSALMKSFVRKRAVLEVRTPPSTSRTRKWRLVEVGQFWVRFQNWQFGLSLDEKGGGLPKLPVLVKQPKLPDLAVVGRALW
jgi:hypothetical protein